MSGMRAKAVRNTAAVLFQFRVTGSRGKAFPNAAKAGNGGLARYENDSVRIRLAAFFIAFRKLASRSRLTMETK